MVTSVTLVAGIFAPGVFAADQELTIDGNGFNSDNTITVTQTSNCTVKQKNTTEVITEAIVGSSTGGVTANNNTGTGVTVDTGDATSKLIVDVSGSSNTADNPCCGCTSNPTVDATIKDNGAQTNNDITSTTTSNKTVKQKNSTFVGTAAVVKSKTGKVTTNGNTGGTVGVTTGNAKSKLKVTVTGSTNTLNP